MIASRLIATVESISPETFANTVTKPVIPISPDTSVLLQPRSRRAATLKTSRKEKQARRPGNEDGREGPRPIRAVSCSEVDWIQLQTTFPTAAHVEQMQLVHMENPSDPEVSAFYFPFGVCVFWGIKRDEVREKVALMNDNGVPEPRPRKVNLTGIQEDDFFYYAHQDPPVPDVSPAATRPLLYQRDGPRFTLYDTRIELKMALSHAFAHSVRLDVLEQQFSRISRVTLHIAPEQRRTGRVPRDWEEVDILSTIGALDAIRREVCIDGPIKNNTHLFWDEDELSEVFDATREYLEIDERADHLLDQIDLVRSQLENLQREIHAVRGTNDHKRAIRREWYIILLIFYEAVVIKLFDIGDWIADLLGLPPLAIRHH